MKTAAKDLVRLMALLESQSNATNSLRASRAIGEGSFNSMKVDYLLFRASQYASQ
jgi:hypothetical protein